MSARPDPDARQRTLLFLILPVLLCLVLLLFLLASSSSSSVSPPSFLSSSSSPPAASAATTGKKVVLLTGGAGFIGSHTAEFLLSRGDNVIIVDEMNDYYDVSLKEDNLSLLRALSAAHPCVSSTQCGDGDCWRRWC